MKFAIVAIAALLAAGSASAGAKVTDVDFLKANRCKGLASSLTGVVDPAALDSFIKAEASARAPYVLERASDEQARARKEARGEDRKDRLTAELAGPCQAYIGRAAGLARKDSSPAS